MRAITTADLPAEFRRELEEGGLDFCAPPGFALVAPRANDQIVYRCALAMRAPKLEMRFHVVTLKPAPAPAGFTREAGADMNTLHLAHLPALLFNMRGTVFSGPHALPEHAVRAEFAADSGTVCRARLEPSAFGEGFSECLVLALHKKDVADAYVLFLFESFEEASPLVERSFRTLVFRPGP